MADYSNEHHKGPVKSDITISTNEVQLHSIEPLIAPEGSLQLDDEAPGLSGADKSRIPLACHACRSRKVRCDGTRPVCNTCARRNDQCVYDFAPKRRGPDRHPGTRQRAPKGTTGAPKKRKRNQEAAAGSATPAPLIVPVKFASPDVPVPPKRRRPSITQNLPSDLQAPAVPISLPGAPPLDDDHSIPAGKISLPSLVRSDDHFVQGYDGLGFQADLPGPSRRSLVESPGSSTFNVGVVQEPHWNTSVNSHQWNATSSDTQSTLSLRPIELPPIPLLTSQRTSTWRDDYNLQLHSAHSPTSTTGFHSVNDTYYSVDDAAPSSAYSEEMYSSQWTPRSTYYSRRYQNVVKTENSEEYYYTDNIARGPSLKFNQETWWDTILLFYSPTSRDEAAHSIVQDLQLIFRTAHTMLSFIHVPFFFNMLYHPERRQKDMQPSLVLGLLAMSTLMQSSEAEGGGERRLKALKLRDFAQAAFDASCNSGSVDTMLAQAAWVFVLFETSPHPLFSDLRLTSAAFVFDNVVRALYLTCIDAANPEAPVFKKNEVPALARTDPVYLATHKSSGSNRSIKPSRSGHSVTPGSAGSSASTNEPPLPSEMTSLMPTIRSVREPLRLSASSSADSSLRPQKQRACPCLSLSMTLSPEAQRSTPLWLMMPRWDSGLTDAEIRVEESRRLVWSSLTLLGGEASARLALSRPQLDLYVTRPENYALLFPGEYLYQKAGDLSSVYSGKESTWALYARAMLLWNVCVRMRESNVSESEKAEYAVRTWLETIAIEEALDEHDCDGEKVTMYQAREYIFITRMHISHEYRSHIPFPHTVDFSRLNRAQAMKWLLHQNAVALQMRQLGLDSLTGIAGKMLSKRPYLIWWWMNQAVRALRLYYLDSSLTLAKEVVENLLPIIDFCEKLWPCAEQRLRKRALVSRWMMVKTLRESHTTSAVIATHTGTTLPKE
ncbi:hypothetical protein FRC03_003070 [Tulasnella sp. 419]|nr:hypothetical protein FRC03_003070 [Tulasnella sp. 419]